VPRERLRARKGTLHGCGNIPGFFTVVLGHSIQDYKEGEQKRNEIGVGN
jgi:hypothetical protein